MSKEFESNNFKLQLLGLSIDYRTNRWRIICKNCGKSQEPDTTMLATQFVQCHNCDNSEDINYNELKENENRN